jgi:uncharacterized protein YodC (DUF2158 family)
MEELKVGDVVQLKSGGPEMTVEEIKPSNNVSCVWFQTPDFIRRTFSIAVLKKIR